MEEESYENTIENTQDNSGNVPIRKKSGTTDAKINLEEFEAEELDEFQKSLSKIKDPNKLNYVLMVIANPNLTDEEMMVRLTCNKRRLRELKLDTTLNHIISVYFKAKISLIQVTEIAQLQRHTAMLDEEIETRFKDMRTNRLTAEDLFANDFSTEQAKIILSQRIEGMSSKDLISSRAALAERAMKLKTISDDSSPEENALIEEISLNWKRYHGKKKEININDFSPDADEFVIEGKLSTTEEP